MNICQLGLDWRKRQTVPSEFARLFFHHLYIIYKFTTPVLFAFQNIFIWEKHGINILFFRWLFWGRESWIQCNLIFISFTVMMWISCSIALWIHVAGLCSLPTLRLAILCLELYCKLLDIMGKRLCVFYLLCAVPCTVCYKINNNWNRIWKGLLLSFFQFP